MLEVQPATKPELSPPPAPPVVAPAPEQEFFRIIRAKSPSSCFVVQRARVVAGRLVDITEATAPDVYPLTVGKLAKLARSPEIG